MGAIPVKDVADFVKAYLKGKVDAGKEKSAATAITKLLNKSDKVTDGDLQKAIYQCGIDSDIAMIAASEVMDKYPNLCSEADESCKSKKKIKAIGECSSKGKEKRKIKAIKEDRWVTIHVPTPDSKGRKVLVDDSGNVVGGAMPKTEEKGRDMDKSTVKKLYKGIKSISKDLDSVLPDMVDKDSHPYKSFATDAEAEKAYKDVINKIEKAYPKGNHRTEDSLSSSNKVMIEAGYDVKPRYKGQKVYKKLISINGDHREAVYLYVEKMGKSVSTMLSNNDNLYRK